MSKPRYPWWGYVRSMVYRYPALRDQHDAAMLMQTTPAYSGMSGGGGDGRGLENLVLRALTRNEAREYEAVAAAIRQTDEAANGALKLRMIRLVYWDRSHTLTGAAMALHIGEATAWRWHGVFIRQVARNFGLLD